ncbi:hypothetical protein OL548_10180 [Lysinibacillus sp. MHQ-1]|nr:hypothetical protein OL548_10180 [Lysinibacillus sp. MHQ-1]
MQIIVRTLAHKYPVVSDLVLFLSIFGYIVEQPLLPVLYTLSDIELENLVYGVFFRS